MKTPIIGWAVRNADGLTTVVMGAEEPPTPPGGEVVRILSVKEVEPVEASVLGWGGPTLPLRSAATARKASRWVAC